MASYGLRPAETGAEDKYWERLGPGGLRHRLTTSGPSGLIYNDDVHTLRVAQAV
jgi:hypothetical protein